MAGRFRSEFDPDELAKITHRGLKPLSGTNEPTVNAEEVSSLKSASRNEAKTGVQARRLMDLFFGGIASALKGLFARKGKKVTQCQIYGHVPEPKWTGPYPKCTDCGAAITRPDEVRGATPRDQRGKSGGDQPPTRRYVK